MSDPNRQFEAGPDPFGRMWKVQFRWLQTGISIRHADTVDVKFFVTPDNGPTEEKVIALSHPELLNLTAGRGYQVTDPLCMRIAAAHLRHMIETSEDMDKTLVTVSSQKLASYTQQLRPETVPRHG